MKKASKAKKEFLSEQAFQEWTAKEVEALGIFGWHTPNEGKMSPQYGAKRKRQGVMAGVADWIIVLHWSPKPVAIELKLPGGKLTGAQEVFRERLLVVGGAYYIASSKQEFWAALADCSACHINRLYERGYQP